MSTSMVIDAEKDPNAAAAALGLGDAPEDEPTTEQDPEGEEPEDGEDELTLDKLAELIAEQKREIAKLKREAAAKRVDEARAKPKVGTEQAEGETPEQARQRGREEARLEYGIELAGASVRAALTGIIPEGDLDEFVDDLRLDRFVGEDGKPDRDAINALRDRQAKITRRKPAARVGHGRQSGTPTAQTKGEMFAEALSKAGF